jgi:hypothetical protein
MRIHPVCLVLGLGAGIASAAEDPACRAPFSSPDQSPSELRAVATSCDDRDVALLFYGRAYHTEVLEELRKMGGLTTYRPTDDLARYHQSRIYAGLIEAFAERAWVGGETAPVVRALNDAYDLSITTVEYTLKGYNALISRIGASEP